MNRLLGAAAAACTTLILASPAGAQRISLVDRIVAVVNSEVVTNSELNERLVVAERQMKRGGTPVPEPRVLERQVLERLVLEKAQLQMAKDTGLRVDEVQLDRTLSRIAVNNKMTLATFRQKREAVNEYVDAEAERIEYDVKADRVEFINRARLRRGGEGTPGARACAADAGGGGPLHGHGAAPEC